VSPPLSRLFPPRDLTLVSFYLFLLFFQAVLFTTPFFRPGFKRAIPFPATRPRCLDFLQALISFFFLNKILRPSHRTAPWFSATRLPILWSMPPVLHGAVVSSFAPSRTICADLFQTIPMRVLFLMSLRSPQLEGCSVQGFPLKTPRDGYASLSSLPSLPVFSLSFYDSCFSVAPCARSTFCAVLPCFLPVRVYPPRFQTCNLILLQCQLVQELLCPP